MAEVLLKDGTRYAAGYRAREFAGPCKAMTDAGRRS